MGLAVMNLARTHQRQLAVVVHIVVPGNELSRPVPGILQGPEPVRVACVVLHRLELRFGEGVVIRLVGP